MPRGVIGERSLASLAEINRRDAITPSVTNYRLGSANSFSQRSSVEEASARSMGPDIKIARIKIKHEAP